ncbi:MAG: glycosyltransferase family 39 protein [Solirubrobacterales bacterium]
MNERGLDRRHLWAVVGLTAIAAILRFATLDVQSFYSDETVTAVLMRMDFGGMLGQLSSSESAPPLYYILAWAWGNVFGTGEVGLRSLSALAGTAVIPVAYLAGTRLRTPRVGLIIAALAAVNPMLVWFSQEARVYALFSLLAALSFFAFVTALKDPRPRTILLWALASAVALAVHYFAAFLIVPEVALLLMAGRERRGILLGSAGVAIVALALLPLAVEQRNNGGTEWISQNSIPSRVADTGFQYLVGPNTPAPLIIPPIAAALVVAGLWLLVRRGSVEDRAAAKVAAIVGVTAIAVPLLAAIVGPDTFLQKTMIMALLPLALVVAIGLGARRAGKVGLVAAGGLCALGVAVVIAVDVTPVLQRDDWRDAADAIDGSPVERALLVNPAVAGRQHRDAIQFYMPSAVRAASARVREIDVLSLNDNGLDAQINGVPEMPSISPPPGFRQTGRKDEDRFTLIRFQSPVDRLVSPQWVKGVEDALQNAGRDVSKLFLLPAGPHPETG